MNRRQSLLLLLKIKLVIILVNNLNNFKQEVQYVLLSFGDAYENIFRI